QHASLRSFIQWWDSNNKVREQSVVIPENENAIRIMTIHKSKGLQFPVVIMPFTDWDMLSRSGNIVWLTSEENPYVKLGKMGIPASPILSESVFENDWRREQSNSVIDNLNLIYVAFTRPEEELYIFSPMPSEDALKKGETNTISKLIFHTLQTAGMPPETDGILKRGTAPENFIPKSEHLVSEPLTSYPVNRWQDKIRVSSRTRKLADLLKERSAEKTRYGVLVHELLSTIGTLEDVEPALDKIRFDGLLPEDEKEQLKSIVLEVTSHPDIKRFFETDWEIKRESEILTPEGEMFRPDRTLTKGKEAVLVDFKTGSASPEHESQLLNYCSLLKSMGYESVTNYLVYLKDGPKVVEVF
ncbi:MAG: 3'-5' exonuclease, partial [Bacteroidota bacterium]